MNTHTKILGVTLNPYLHTTNTCPQQKREAIISRLLYMKKKLPFNLCVKKGDNNQTYLCTIICCLFQGRVEKNGSRPVRIVASSSDED